MEIREIVTVRGAVPLIDPEAAVMITEPFDFALTRPLFEIVTRAGLEALQVTAPLIFWLLPSL